MIVHLVMQFRQWEKLTLDSVDDMQQRMLLNIDLDPNANYYRSNPRNSLYKTLDTLLLVSLLL